ncbi:MAG TPA: hypothetical protein VN836_07430 [Verrucomicrobiae bacterium]|nr:hypothetical protein [Verrucomicrobiae bacterium]
MNLDDAKTVLLLYRPGPADTGDPQTAEALALAKREPELARWLEAHCARQEALRTKFRQIAAPAGLKEQIISEQAARARIISWRRKAVFAVTAVMAGLIVLASLWFTRQPKDDTFATYRIRMVRIASLGYRMDLATNNPAAIRAYFVESNAPADYALTAPLEKTATTGCAVENWRGAKVSMVCFHTGRPLPPGQSSDLWLFVIDRAAVKNAPAAGAPRFARVNNLMTATWTEGGKLYVLGMEGNEAALRQYL